MTQIKEYPKDPFQNKTNYSFKSEQTKGRYTIISYEKSHGLAWKVRQGTLAFFTRPWSKKKWKEAFTGKSIKQAKVSLKIADPVPLQADFAYRGSNAEYLVMKKSGRPCSLNQFEKASLPITAKRFPRPDGIEASESLMENESAVIESELADAGLISVKIPKSLYDLFYLRFHLEERVDASAKKEDIKKIKQLAQKNLPESEGKHPEMRHYVYNPDGNITIHAPIIDFDLSKYEKKPKKVFNRVINRRYVKHESDQNYINVQHRLNDRILSYMKDKEMDPQNLDWGQMRKITESLLTDMDTLCQKPIMENIDNGEIIDFLRHYQRNTPRMKAFLLGAIWHEYQAPPGVYTVYRGAVAEKDDAASKDPYSFSYGHSALSGAQFDGGTGSPASFARNNRDLMAIDINIKDYENKGESFQFIHIPQARGINRMRGHGEAGHIRSKVKYQKESSVRIAGFYGGGTLGIDERRLEFVATPVATDQEVEQHNKTSRVFFKAMRTLVLTAEAQS